MGVGNITVAMSTEFYARVNKYCYYIGLVISNADVLYLVPNGTSVGRLRPVFFMLYGTKLQYGFTRI